jgi:cardiolipin synthase
MPVLPWFDIFVVSYVVWVVLACVSLLLNRRSPTATLAWIFAFVALPVVSGLYYMFFGPRRLQRRKRRYGVARAMAASVAEHLRATACERKPQLTSDASALAAVGRRLNQGHPTFAEKVTLLDTGDETMQSLEGAIRAARHHVHLEYYIWEPDYIGTLFRDLLAEAVGRGVGVGGR